MATPEQVEDLSRKMAEEREALIALCLRIDEERAEYQPPDAEGEGGWSVKEQLSHLAEMEAKYRSWVERALREDRPDLTGTVPDPVGFPLEQAHAATVDQLLEELARQRGLTETLVAGLTVADCERTATQGSFGELTVLQWLRSYYRHDRMHRAQIDGREPDYRPQFLNGEPDQRRR